MELVVGKKLRNIKALWVGKWNHITRYTRCHIHKVIAPYNDAVVYISQYGLYYFNEKELNESFREEVV